MQKLVLETESGVRDFLTQAHIKGMLPNDLQVALDSGRLQLEEDSLYKRLSIQGSSSIEELLVSTDEEVQGVTNITARKLQDAFVMTGIAIRTLSVDSATMTPKKANAFTRKRASVPAGVANGKLEVKQSNKPVFAVEAFKTLVESETAGGELAPYFPLRTPRLMLPSVQTNWTFTYCDGETIAQGGTNPVSILEVEIVGYKLKVRG
jgi:hypothetical protein